MRPCGGQSSLAPRLRGDSAPQAHPLLAPSLQQVFARGSAPPDVTSFREKDRQSLSSQAALSLFQKGRTPHTLPPMSQPEQGITPCKDQPVAGRAEMSRTALDQSRSFRGQAGHCPPAPRVPGGSLEAPWRPGAPGNH